MLDSGTSSHFLLTEAPVLNKIIAQNPIDIRLPDGSQVQSSHIGELDNPHLPATLRTCHIVPGLASHPLIWVIKLSNAGREITFTKFGTGVEVRYRNRLIWTGKKCTQTGLWMVPLIPAAQATTLPATLPRVSHSANFATTGTADSAAAHSIPSLQHVKDNELPPYCSITNNVHPIAKIPLMANLAINSHYGPVPVPKNCVVPVPTDPPSNSSSFKFSYEIAAFPILETSSQEELAKYHHQTVGSPPKSTFLRSIRDHPLQWKTFPGLSYELICKHLPQSMATYQGHTIRNWSGYNSTRRNRLRILDARKDVQDVFPTEQVCAITEDDMFVFTMLGNAHTNTLYTDLTGRFPV